MLAFEAWISAQDRKSDHLLINVVSSSDVSGDILQLAFIDYAYSLSMSWPAPDATVGAPGGYVPVTRHDVSTRAMADRILQVPDEAIKTIVDRIPPEYLSQDRRANIVANLLSRRGKLHAMLGLK